MGKANVVVVGATGAVGTVFLQLLEERKFPVGHLRLCASPRSVGKRLKVNGQEVAVEAVTPQVFEGADFVFISASGEVSKRWAPVAAQVGALAIDDSSVFRMDPQVPLVVPEVNGDDLVSHRGLVAIPNCSTTQMVMALYPLHRRNPIRRVIVDTFQSVSGTGKLAMQELTDQSRALLEGKPVENRVYPHRIGFNVLPHIDAFLDNGYTKEEWKMVEETRKIMHAPELAVSATCVRVPVYLSHSEAVHVEFQEPMSPQEARELLAAFPGVSVVDDPAKNQYPLAWEAAGKDEVYVGRVRRDASHPCGLAFWVVADNLRKGAALNAIQIAEEALKRNLLLSRAAPTSLQAGMSTSIPGGGWGSGAVTRMGPPAQRDGEKSEGTTFDADCKWFAGHKQELSARYDGQFIAVLHGKVIDSDADFGELAGRVYEKHGYRDLFMPLVKELSGPLRVPSPRMARPTG